jgi:GNAT superfamily N-acetyltransferase
MVELRPHLIEQEFVGRVQRQQSQGYHLVYVDHRQTPLALAGYRYGHNLAWGDYLYVDDLVTASGQRRQGAGGRLMEWLIAEACAHGCAQLHLDSGMQRFEAHRLYHRYHLGITSHHFSLPLSSSPHA